MNSNQARVGVKWFRAPWVNAKTNRRGRRREPHNLCGRWVRSTVDEGDGGSVHRHFSPRIWGSSFQSSNLVLAPYIYPHIGVNTSPASFYLWSHPPPGLITNCFSHVEEYVSRFQREPTQHPESIRPYSADRACMYQLQVSPIVRMCLVYC